MTALTTNGVPLSFEAAAPDGSWVLFCEAPADTNGDGRIEVSVGPRGELTGDDLRRRFLALPELDRSIDDLLVTSEDGRRSLVSHDGGLFLVERGSERPIHLPGADLRSEPGTRRAHRTLAIVGDELFYIRSAKQRSELVVRSLASGRERVEYSGTDRVLSMHVHEQGKLVVLRVAGADTNGNGRFEGPFTPSNKPRPCPSPIPTHRANRRNGDALSAVIVTRPNGTWRRVDDLVMPFGTGLIRRRQDGSLLVERNGRSSVLGDSTCAGRVLFPDPSRDQLLLGCRMPKNRVRQTVELVRGTQRLPLGIDLAAYALDEPPAPPQRALPLYPGSDSALFDLEERKLIALRPGDTVLHVVGTRALVRGGRSLRFFTLEGGDEAPLPEQLDPYGGVLVQGDLLYVSPLVIDVGKGKVLGRVPGPALALTRSGAVLLPASPASAESLARGPLRWQSPEP